MKNFYTLTLRVSTLLLLLVSGKLCSASPSNDPGTLTASFTINASKQCLKGNSFALNNQSSTGTGITYFWDFGDGTSSTDANPVKSYSYAGNFRIHLEVRNGNDYSFVEKFIDVMPVPEVDFKTLSGTLNGQSFTYISTSTIQSGSMNYYWDLGNNTSSTLINPTVTYASAGNYTVKLKVTSDFGCADSVTKVTAYNTDCVPPTASFSVNGTQQCKKNNQFIFTNASSGNGNLSYHWDFGDGTTSEDANPMKTFDQTGVYAVKLTVTSSAGSGCSSTSNQTVEVSGSTAAFVVNPTSLQCFSGNHFIFTNESSAHGAYSFNWDLGDGTTSSEINPERTYAAPGTYTARLVVRMAGDVCNDTLYKTLTVYPSPTAAFSVNNNSQCLKNNAFAFTNQSAISSGNMNYVWMFGEGVNSSTDNNPTYSYSNNGKYNVKLIVSSDHGCKDSATQVVNIDAAKAAFVINPASIQCFKNNSFVFTNESSSTNSSLHYNWDLSGGITSTQVNPTRTFNTPGTYTIQLIVSATNNSCKDTLVKSLVVNPSPVADFSSRMISYSDNSITLSFNNNSSITSGNIHYEWNFGDGQVSSFLAPSHAFANNAVSTVVKLKAISDHGCEVSVSKVVSLINGQQVRGSMSTNPSSTPTDVHISTYPNPAVSFAQINVQTTTTQLGMVLVKVADRNGRILFEKTQAANSNTQAIITIATQNLVPGTYFVEVFNGNGQRIGSNILVKSR
ncbi:MAG: PKD domain-containing protein [Bacteroidota bacterium]|nr:PKD domain-containing protein [Bacteroidota bacterium]